VVILNIKESNIMSKYILDREKFLLEKYVSVGENTEITDNEQVAVIQGRFNPCAHIGHLNMIKNAHRLTGKRIFVIQILSNNSKSPLKDEGVLEKMANEIVKHNSEICGWEIFNADKEHAAFLPNIITFTRENGYEPVALCCGEDRFNDYQSSLDRMNDPAMKEKALQKDPNAKLVEILPEFEIVIADDRTGGYSSTKIREAMVLGDEEFVKANIPDYLYPYCDVMKDAVVKVAEEEANKPKRIRKK
jgi:nicotinic acid mononucleotide adenylyltransferase